MNPEWIFKNIILKVEFVSVIITQINSSNPQVICLDDCLVP